MTSPASVKTDSVTVAPPQIAENPDRVFRNDLVAILPSLRAFARGLCGNRDFADDLVQEAMTRAWAARSSYTPGTNFRAWMFMILRNRYFTIIRKNARSVSWDPEVAERVLVTAASQENRLHVQDVADALQKLPKEQREVLLLIGANGMSYEEAMEVVGCAMGTIKSRLARGRVALAALINGPGDEGDVDIQEHISGRVGAVVEQRRRASAIG